MKNHLTLKITGAILALILTAAFGTAALAVSENTGENAFAASAELLRLDEQDDLSGVVRQLTILSASGEPSAEPSGEPSGEPSPDPSGEPTPEPDAPSFLRRAVGSFEMYAERMEDTFRQVMTAFSHFMSELRDIF